jgi:hypothetical protein
MVIIAVEAAAFDGKKWTLQSTLTTANKSRHGLSNPLLVSELWRLLGLRVSGEASFRKF